MIETHQISSCSLSLKSLVRSIDRSPIFLRMRSDVDETAKRFEFGCLFEDDFVPPFPLLFLFSKSDSDSNDLGCFDNRILPSDRVATSRLVIVAAVVTIGVPVLAAEQLSAPTSEPGQTDLPPAS